MAEDHNGVLLAVKVQHEGLRESAKADIATIQALVSLASYVFPQVRAQGSLPPRERCATGRRCVCSSAQPLLLACPRRWSPVLAMYSLYCLPV